MRTFRHSFLSTGLVLTALMGWTAALPVPAGAAAGWALPFATAPGLQDKPPTRVVQAPPLLAPAPALTPAQGNPVAVISTSLGDIAIELFKDRAPVSVENLVGHLEDIDYTLIDARGADRFRGENETVDPVAGHIPGAHNRPYARNLNADNTFKDAATLRADWQAVLAGRKPEQIVHSCGSGVTACNNALAMEIAGLPGSRLYPGSWSEWSSDKSRPIDQ